MSKTWRALGLGILLFLGAAACSDSDFEASQSPAGGTIIVNDFRSSPLTLNGVTWVIGATQTTITLRGTYYNPESRQQEYPTLLVVVPNGVTFSPIDLENSGSTFTDASFTTVSVAGEATLFGITSNALSAEINAVFTDAMGNTREVGSVNMIVGDFSPRT